MERDLIASADKSPERIGRLVAEGHLQWPEFMLYRASHRTGIHYTETCAGTGKSTDINNYLTRPRSAGDLHGQAPMLWFAYALLATYR